MADNIEMQDVKEALEGNIEPRQQQIFNTAAMTENPNQNFVNRQPVGTGKTEQAMMAMTAKAHQMSQEDEDYTGLVVLPSNSLVSQWENRFEEHGLSDEDLFDVRRSKSKDEFSTFETVRSMPDHMNDRKSQAIKQGKRDFKNHKSLVYGSEALSEDWFNSNGKSGADVILTTHHMLKSDIKNGRIDPENFDVDDVVIDEATAFVARNQESNQEDTFYGGHRVAENFKELMENTYDKDDTRVMGLTALPGRKLEPIIDYLGADLVSPPEESLEVSMAEVDRYINEVEENLMVEDPFSRDEDEEIGYTESVLKDMFSELDDAREDFRHVVVNNTDQSIRQEANVYGYVGHQNEEIDEHARRVLSIENNIQRVYEGGIGTFKEDLPAGYRNPKMERLEDISAEWDQQNENYIMFASHKDTAEQIGELTDADVVTGDYTSEHNNSVLEDFGADTNSVVMTYDYGAEGIDLPEGDRVLHMSDRINPQLKLSATGRAKRGDDIEEHTLVYESEDISDREAIDYGEDVVPRSSQSSRNTIRKMLGQTESEIHDMVQERTMRGGGEIYGHLMNTPPASDR
ncbi:DEAD/DEAH box helicase [Nanohaloarchaea archaeon]|nr:DEAD/DEAH box helicase [Candidatus Nanohaloarchaea archaeon]